MKGGRNASFIVAEMRRKQYYQNKVVRQKCVIDKEKQCNKCQYRDICDDKEINEEE